MPLKLAAIACASLVKIAVKESSPSLIPYIEVESLEIIALACITSTLTVICAPCAGSRLSGISQVTAFPVVV